MDWQSIASRLDQSIVELDRAEAHVLKHNRGPAVDAFQKHYFGILRIYVSQVASYCRHLGTTTSEYGDELSKVQRALAVIAANLWTNIIYTSWYGFGTGYAILASERIMLILEAKAQSALWTKIVWALIQKMGTERFRNAIVYPVVDGLWWGALQQGVQATTMAGGEFAYHIDNKTLTKYNGFDPFDVGTNLKQGREGAVATVAFDYSLMATDKTPYLNRGHAKWGGPDARSWKSRWAGLGGRMVASNVWSYTINLQEGEDPIEAVPSGQAQMYKLAAHSPRMFIFPRRS